jgi:hypothetical protein
MRRFTRTLWLAALCGLLLAGPALAQGPGPTPVAPTVPGAQPPAVCSIGQPCVLDGLTLTVNSATTTDTVDGLAAPPAGFTYLVLNVSIALAGQDQVPYSPNYFVVRTADGYQTSFIPLESIDGLGNGMFWSGTNLRTDVAFVVPVGARGLVAVYRPLLPDVGFAELSVDLGM